MSITESQNSSESDKSPSGAPGQAWQESVAPFLRRTAIATVVTLLLVGLTIAVYAGPGLAARYLVGGFWALVFFGLTPLIFKTMLAERRRWVGLGLVGLKIVWLVALFMICKYWAIAPGSGAAPGVVVIAGLTTPLIVLALRAIGTASQQTVSRSRRSISPTDSRP